MTHDLVVFDLDGTLVDTAPDLVTSLNHTIALDGLTPVTYDDLTHLVGQGARVMIARAFALRKAELSTERHDVLFHEFIAHYANGMPGKSQPFPGILDALDRLKSAGIGLAVCTNKSEGLAKQLLSAMNLDHFFPVITGGDTFSVRKPHADHLLQTVALAGGNPTRSIMVGDSVNDIQVAQNASIVSLAVPFGYSDVPVESLKPTHIIQHFDELDVALVKDLLNR